MMKPGMLPPGMQRMPYPQPSAPQAPLPPYLQALLGGLPQGAMGLPMQAMQNAPGMMPAPQAAASGLQPMGQGGGLLPPYLQALFPSGIPSASAALEMPGMGRPSISQKPGNDLVALPAASRSGMDDARFPVGGNGAEMMPAPLEAASIAPQSGPFRPFSFLGAPSRAMSYR